MMIKLWSLFLMVFIIFPMKHLNAQNTPTKTLYGFASWGYARSDGNEYAGAKKVGEYNNLDYSLLLLANPFPKLRVNSSLEFRNGSLGDVKTHDQATLEELHAEINFIFTEWSFSDVFKMRLGKVKHPFGLFGEIIDVGVVRPFLTLPAGMYGPGMIAEAYYGVGITGGFYGENFGMEYDVYGGGLSVGKNVAFLHAKEVKGDTIKSHAGGHHEEEEEESSEIFIREAFGARATFNLPIEGLIVGFSGFSGKYGEEGEESRRSTWLSAYGEFSTDHWIYRAEYNHSYRTNIDHESLYAESAVSLGSKWQLAGRFEWSKARLTTEGSREFSKEEFAARSDFFEHQEIVGGLNYWYSPSFVLKLSLHRVNGFMFAHPDVPAKKGYVLLEDTNPKTWMVLFGSDFSFGY